MERLKKISAVLSVLLKILRCLVVVCLVIFTALALATILAGEKLMPHLNISVSVGSEIFIPDAQTLLELLKSPWFVLVVFLGVLAVDTLFAVWWYGAGIFCRILQPMKAGRPFEEGVSGLIRRLAWVVLIGGILNEVLLIIAQCVAESAVLAYVPDRYDALLTLLESAGGVDLSFLLISLILFMLSLIFSYGEELQRESDETL